MMIEQNLEYLKKTLDYLGFGKRLNDVMENAIRRDMPKFTIGLNNTYIPAQLPNKQPVAADHIRYELNFNRSNNSDMYFLNNYKVSLHQAGEPEPRIQTFDLERDHRVTALQAYKLLSGQSFEKDIYPKAREGEEKPEKVRTWFKLELGVTDAYGNHPLRTFRPEYGYQLEDSLAKYPLKGLDTPEKIEEAAKATRNGNLIAADLTLNKKQVPVLIGANPLMKKLDVFDKNREAVRDWDIFPEQAAAFREKNQAPTAHGPADAGFEQHPWEQEANQGRTVAVGR